MNSRFNLNLTPSAQKPFWKHLQKECVVQIVDESQRKARKDILSSLQENVERGRYKPFPLIGKLTSQKSKGVPRFIPVFEAVDYSVYFGAVKAMDVALARQAVKNTFGGWSLGGERRKAEEEQMKLILTDIGDEYTPESSYTKISWFQNWQEFWRLLDAKFSDGRYPIIARLDIANFYDNIELPLLDRELRAACPAQTGAIDVLQYFLREWDNEHRPYEPKVKGLPQDIVGDCSRVLANFYLTPFDRDLAARAEKLGAEPVRWADDVFIGCPSRGVATELIYFATDILNRRGLSIGTHKVEYETPAAFNDFWRFDIFREADNENFEHGLDLLDQAWGSNFGRRTTCFKTAISKVANTEVDPRWKDWIQEKIAEAPDVLLAFGESQFKNLFRIYESQGQLLQDVINPIHHCKFTQTKAALLRAINIRKNENHTGMLSAAESVMRKSLAESEDAASQRLANSYWVKSNLKRKPADQPILWN